MSRDFIQDLPENLRKLYDLPITPDPLKTKFETISKMERVKENARKNSALFKIFNEDLFTFMTIDGELNFNMTFLNPKDLLEAIDQTLSQFEQMSDAIKAVGDGYHTLLIPNKDGVEGNEKTAKLKFDAEKLVDQIQQDSKDLTEARNDIIDEFFLTDKVCGTDPYSRYQYTYVDSETAQFTKSINKMLFEINYRQLDTQSQMYFRYALKVKPLRMAFARINWKRDL